MSASPSPTSPPASAALDDGAHVRVAGTIRPIESVPLTAPLSGQPCVYWDVREGLAEQPRERAGQPFWLDGPSGSVLIRGDALWVDARPERRKAMLESAENDLAALSERLHEIKELRRKAGGEKARALRAEHDRLAQVVTVLCMIRAHARGRVHGKGTLESQETRIRNRSHLVQPGAGQASFMLMVDRWETVLVAGQHVAVEGVVQREPAPPELATGAGYRSAATIAVLVGTDARGVRLAGTGENAPLTAAQRRELARESSEGATGRAARRRRGQPGARKLVIASVLTAAGVALAVLLEMLAR